jgi:hypothetical protein
MREIDDTENAEYEGQPARGEKDQQSILHAVEDLDEDEIHSGNLSNVMAGLVPAI